jgi:cysteinyl-tRNA synthetase
VALTLYNTLTRRKEAFRPIDATNVRMYVCGPTVYDFAHIGNARPIIVFDLLYRLLRHTYGENHVTYARNITDVDDKINARAAERFPGLDPTEAIRRVTTETTEQFHKDIAALGVLPPSVEPRATDHIEDMRELCKSLVEKGHAYVAEGHVLFAVDSMADYGKLSGRSLEEMEAGARVDVAPYKRNPMDFVLWKPSGADQPGWSSPCGITQPGRPGWHIECSAMAGRHLGPVFDIHGGGIDLVFPHHENEVAQSRCAHGTPVMANVWMHNGFLQVEGQKMSKSLGNFITINELLETNKFGGRRWEGDVIRFAMLKTHYRQPIDWTPSLLEEARQNLNSLAGVRYDFYPSKPSLQFLEALADDLNSKAAIDELFQLAKRARSGDASAGGQLAGSLGLLGFFTEERIFSWPGRGVDERGNVAVDSLDPDAYRREFLEILPRNVTTREFKIELSKNSPELPLEMVCFFQKLVGNAADGAFCFEVFGDLNRFSTVEALIAARLAARKAKDFKEGDRIRDELAAMGIALKDSKDPATGEIVTSWEIKR